MLYSKVENKMNRRNKTNGHLSQFYKEDIEVALAYIKAKLLGFPNRVNISSLKRELFDVAINKDWNLIVWFFTSVMWSHYLLYWNRQDWILREDNMQYYTR